MITKEDIDWIKENKGDDVGFLFYSGDVLQDIAMLNTKTKGVYMSIMCLHMKNICFSQSQICSFCEVLNDQEKETLFDILKNIGDCYFIEWVLESIKKRREYSISRSKNRTSDKEIKPKKTKNISKTYVKHMVNENEIEDENKKEKELEVLLSVFNEFTKSNIKDFSSVLKNYEHWRKIYEPSEIQQAIQNIPNHDFWNNKMTFNILFRQKNTAKENVDYISDLLNFKVTSKNKTQEDGLKSAVFGALTKLNGLN